MARVNENFLPLGILRGYVPWNFLSHRPVLQDCADLPHIDNGAGVTLTVQWNHPEMLREQSLLRAETARLPL